LAGLDLQDVDFAGASYLPFRQFGLAGANKSTLDRMSQGLRFESDCQPDFLFGRCALLSKFLWRPSGACLCFRLDLLLDSPHHHLHQLYKIANTLIEP